MKLVLQASDTSKINVSISCINDFLNNLVEEEIATVGAMVGSTNVIIIS